MSVDLVYDTWRQVALQVDDLIEYLALLRGPARVLLQSEYAQEVLERATRLYETTFSRPSDGQVYTFAKRVLDVARAPHFDTRLDPYDAIIAATRVSSLLVRATLEAVFGEQPQVRDRTRFGYSSVAMSRARGRAAIELPIAARPEDGARYMQLAQPHTYLRIGVLGGAFASDTGKPMLLLARVRDAPRSFEDVSYLETGGGIEWEEAQDGSIRIKSVDIDRLWTYASISCAAAASWRFDDLDTMALLPACLRTMAPSTHPGVDDDKVEAVLWTMVQGGLPNPFLAPGARNDVVILATPAVDTPV